jgi:iron complex transport system ATP-binding protein
VSLNILSSNDVSYYYRGKIQALADVDFTVKEGDFVSVIGPNGSGKSTLLSVISGILKPSAGTVMLGDKYLHELDRKEIARKIAFVPQNIQVDFPFTCREIVLMGRYPHLSGLGIEKTTDKQVAEKAIEQTGIAHLADRMIYQLSGGERQRVFIAQAIAAEPEILMLDEPVSALDIKYKVQIMDLLQKLNEEKNITIVVILHDLNLAASYSKNILLLKSGKVYKYGSPDETIQAEFIRDVFDIDVNILRNPETGEAFINPRKLFIENKKMPKTG